MTNQPTNKNNDENIVLDLIPEENPNRELHVSASGRTSYKNASYRRFTSKAKKSKILKALNIIGIVLIVLFLLIVIGTFIFLKVSTDAGRKELLKPNEDAVISVARDATTEDKGHTVKYKGNTYRFNKNIASIVVMGVDKSELSAESGVAGQADAIYIFTYDTVSGKCCLIPVSRETMTDVRIRSISGNDAGMDFMQLCLAYAYGDGKETSCENTLESLSRIFYNIPFTTYVALNWDSVAPLNDAIGGVAIKPLEDVSFGDTFLKKDEEVILKGYDAFAYIKYRDTTKLESNPDRLNRQKQYLSAYINKLIPMAKNDITIISDLYNTASSYMYTNLTQQKLVYIASEMLPNLYSSKDINYMNIEGKIVQGERYAEFYPDDDSLYQTILDVFYLKDEVSETTTGTATGN